MIELSHISKSYQEKLVLKDISFSLEEGECLSLLGINGAGKTTLSHIIAGIKAPVSGEIYYNKESIYNDIGSYKKVIGFCQQTPNLDSNLTLKENLFFSFLLKNFLFILIGIFSKEKNLVSKIFLM